MFTTIKSVSIGNDKDLIEAACLSTDTKPTDGIANGSLCLEMNTGDIYAFDEDGTEWVNISGTDNNGGGTE